MVMGLTYLQRRKLAAAARLIPFEDMVGPQYDTAEETPTTDVVVLLSTPRSGSTLLCELLRLNAGCLAHEYFQPFQYMPILADRWGCRHGRTFDEAAYVSALRRHRTLGNGWLGINLHGSHLRHFRRMEAHLRDVRFHYVHLVRKDQIAQAISFEIAVQERKWSSEFASRATAEYSFPRILRMLGVIQNQNAVIESYLLARGESFQTVTYEDLAAKPEDVLRRFACIPPGRDLSVVPNLCRQSDGRSAEWKRRFAEDVLADQSLRSRDAWDVADLRRMLKHPRLKVTQR
jgi:LPS sulfotransferase NodH